MILTNKYTVTYNMENIDRDFDIYEVNKKSKKLENTNVLDLASNVYKARAVQYTKGWRAFVLFDKNAVEENKFKEVICRDYPDTTVRKMNIIDEDECRVFFWQKRLLAQLLMNSIRVPKQMEFAYNNLTGKLFYHQPKWQARDKKTGRIMMMYFLEIAFDKGMYLNLNVKTFMTKQKSGGNRCYLIDSKTGCFRRKLATDICNEQDVFTEASFKKHKNTIDYLDFKSFEKFCECKLGILEQFTQDVEKYLGDYITLEPGKREEDRGVPISQKEKEDLTVSDYSAILNERGVNIVDAARDEVSAEMTARIVQELTKHYGVTPTIGEVEKTAYNIRLIHDEEYYESCEQHDPHQDDLHGYIVQHITEEEYKKHIHPISEKPEQMFHKVILELILKGDVRTGKISVFNWQKLFSGKKWTFVTRRKLRDMMVPQGGVENLTDGRNFAYYQYVYVQVQENGELEFGNFNDTGMCSSDFEERIRYEYEKYDTEQHKKNGKVIEGLVFSELNNIQVILRTNEKTMPNTRNIWQGLKAAKDKDAVLTDIVCEALEAFSESNPAYDNFSKETRAVLLKLTPTVTKKELRKIINMRTKAAKQFNRFFYANYDIRISAEMKDQNFEEDYLLENVLDIKYFIDEDTDGTGVESLNYYVGPTRKQIQSSIHNASVIRQVLAEQRLEFRELLPLMTVDFVRIGQYTVLPFTFKYLREYMNYL